MRVRPPLLAALFAATLTACSTVPTTPAVPVAELAPTGKFRVAINYGNVVLAKRNAAGEPEGVVIDLAREAAKRASLPLEFVLFASPAQAFEGLKVGKADAAFLAADPARAADVDFTTPYVQIQAAYLVRTDSPLRNVEEVDRPGTRISVSLNAGYDLYLTRTLKAATLVRQPVGVDVVDAVMENKADVAAGLRQAMLQEQRKRTGVRLLDGDFMLIDHAMAVPRGRAAAQAWLTRFVEDMKRSGFVADSLVRHGSEGARSAPLR